MTGAGPDLTFEGLDHGGADEGRWLAVAASCGAMALTGRTDGPPLTVPPGLIAAADAASTAIRRLTNGVVELDGPALLGERAACEGLTRRGPWSVGGECRALRTANGWVAVSLSRESDLEAVPAVISSDDAGQPWEALERWVAQETTQEAVARIRLLEIPASAVAEAGSDLSSTSGILARALPAAPERDRAGRADPRPLVVDLSSLWAGPLCADILGLAGFRVVKVEAVGRPDGARRGNPTFYDLMHAGHESVSVDFTTAAGRAALRLVLGQADVVIEASRPRALLALDLTPEPLLRAGGVWVSITAHGRDGDNARLVGFGDDVAAGAGAWVVDPHSSSPTPACDAVADPLTGLFAAQAVLEARQRGGRWFVDASMARITAEAVGPASTPLASPAQRDGGNWWLSGSRGELPVAAPRARQPRGRAVASGAHTASVLAELRGASQP